MEESPFAKVIANVARQCKVHSSQVEDIYPCTPLQHGLIALSTVSTGAYIAQHVFKLQDDVDPERMKKAWNMVIRQNAILRTMIITMKTRALQVVLKDWLPEWANCTDLSTYLTNEQQCTMRYSEPLSRLAISETHLVWTVHHSIYDGSSMDLMLRDIAAAYRDESLPIRTPFRTFIKYIEHSPDKAQCRAFWTSQLSIKDVLPFPIIRQPNYRSRPKNTITHHAQSVMTSSSQVTAATLVQAAWGLTLSSYLVSPTVSFGCTLNGRNTHIANIESMMGPTIATVPVCLRLDFEQTVAQYLQDMQQHFMQMIPFQHSGLQIIKEISQEATQACNFQNLLAIHPAEQDGQQPPYSSLFIRENAESRESFLSYALTVQCSLASNGVMNALASFDEIVVDTSQMIRILSQLEHVTRQLASSNTGTKLRDISLVNPEDLK